jgi:hypothetical protein
MNVWRPLAAVAALALCSVSTAAYGADGSGPFGGPPPQRSVEERPFGGPPPMRRSMDRKPWGTNCKTPAARCKLSKAQEVGSACACPGDDGKPGIVEATK